MHNHTAAFRIKKLNLFSAIFSMFIVLSFLNEKRITPSILIQVIFFNKLTFFYLRKIGHCKLLCYQVSLLEEFRSDECSQSFGKSACS